MGPLVAINQLEREIFSAEHGSEKRRWHQAELVFTLVKATTLSQVAAGWTNAETGRFYSVAHVSFVCKVWRAYGASTQRPKFAKAYREAQGKGTSSPAGRALNTIVRLSKTVEPLLTTLPDLSNDERQQAATAVAQALRVLSNLQRRMADWDNNMVVDPALARDLERLRALNPDATLQLVATA